MLKTVLVVEDEKEIKNFIKKALVDQGYNVEEAGDGAEAIKKVEGDMPDLVILDLGLPKISGETVAAEIKRDYPHIPIIMLTARTQSSDIIAGFKLGADNYMPKPFIMDELLARVKARLSSSGSDNNVLKVADLELNNASKEVKRGGRLISLTPKEFELLHYLMSNTGRVLSREMILNKVWLYYPEIESRAVDVYIGYLRRKIDSGRKKKLIKSIRGFGYTVKAS